MQCYERHPKLLPFLPKIPSEKQGRSQGWPCTGKASPTCATWPSHAHGPPSVQFPFGSGEGVGRGPGQGLRLLSPNPGACSPQPVSKTNKTKYRGHRQMNCLAEKGADSTHVPALSLKLLQCSSQVPEVHRPVTPASLADFAKRSLTTN